MAPDTMPWLRAMRAYLAVTGLGNLAWETAHLPLYTIWATGSLGEQVFAVVHCTGGDMLIALAALALALALAGGWGLRPVVLLTLGVGLAYTGLSEWLNVYVRQSWAYSQWMPVLPIGPYRIGFSPLLQWLVVPSAALWAAGRMLRRTG